MKGKTSKMNLDDILDFLFHKALGICITIGSVFALMFALSGCAPFDICACFWSCGDPYNRNDCSNACIECSEGIDSCFLYSFSDGEGDCAMVNCLFGSGCEAECGDCYAYCGGCNVTFYEAICMSMCGQTETGCIDYEGYDRYACLNCYAFLDAKTDPDSPIFDRELLYKWSITIVDREGNRTEMKLYEDTKYIPYTAPATGMTFKGYFYEPNGQGNAYTDGKGEFTELPEEGSVLYAYYVDQFTGLEYEVNIYNDAYVDEDGKTVEATLIDSFTATLGDDVAGRLPSVTAPEGYTFNGWYYLTVDGVKYFIGDTEGFDDGYNVFDPRDYGISTPDACEISVYAYFVPANYTVTIIHSQTSERKEVTVPWATKYIDIACPFGATDGFKFIGYAESSFATGDSIFGENASVAGNTTIYAIYSQEIRIYFEGEDAPRVFAIGEKINLEAPMNSPAGKSYAGWMFEDMQGVIYNDDNPLIVDQSMNFKTLVPAWVTANYKITYYVDGVKWGDGSYVYGQEKGLDQNVTKQYYTFVGWCNNASLTGNTMFTIPVGSQGDIDLYAKFSPKSYTLSFNPMNGQSIDAFVIKYGDSAKQLPIPTPLPGKTFKAWVYTARGVEVEFTDGTGMMKRSFTVENLNGLQGDAELNSILLTAKYVDNEYTVTFKTDDGAIIGEPIKFTHGDYLTLPTAPEKKGHDFVEWKYNGNTVTTADKVTSNMTVIAVYEAKVYTIRLVIKDPNAQFASGAREITVTYTYGSTVLTVGDTPVKENAIFNGWKTASGTHVVGSDGKVLLALLESVIVNNLVLEAEFISLNSN